MLLARRGVVGVEVATHSKLSGDLGLDSLELAELSAALEDDLGRDAFANGVLPRTVGDLLVFYQA
jgi:hypothetical protein